MYPFCSTQDNSKTIKEDLDTKQDNKVEQIKKQFLLKAKILKKDKSHKKYLKQMKKRRRNE